MRHALALSIALVASCAPFAAPGTQAAAADIPSPSAYLKMSIGADRVIADYRQIRSYFALLDERSPRVAVEHLGPTTLGEDLIMANVFRKRRR